MTYPVEREWLLIGAAADRELPEAAHHTVPVTLQPWGLKLLAVLTEHTLVFRQEAFTAAVQLASPCCGSELHHIARQDTQTMLVQCGSCATLLWNEAVHQLRPAMATVKTWDETGKGLAAVPTLRPALEQWLMDTAAPTLALPLLVARYEELLEGLLWEELQKLPYFRTHSFDPI